MVKMPKYRARVVGDYIHVEILFLVSAYLHISGIYKILSFGCFINGWKYVISRILDSYRIFVLVRVICAYMGRLDLHGPVILEGYDLVFNR